MSLKKSATGVKIPKNKIAKIVREMTKPMPSPRIIHRRYTGVMTRGNAKSARLMPQAMSAHRRGVLASFSSGKSAISAKIAAQIVRKVRKSLVVGVGFIVAPFGLGFGHWAFSFWRLFRESALGFSVTYL